MTNDVQIKAPKRRKVASLDKRKARAGWVFVLPFLIGFILIYLPIVFDSIRYSFHTIKTVIVNMLKLLESVLRIDARKSFSVGSVVRSLNG